MNQRVTFFGLSGPTTRGQSHHCAVHVAGEDRDLSIATRGSRASVARLCKRRREFSTLDGYRDFLKQLDQAILDRGGGVIVEVAEGAREATLRPLVTNSFGNPGALLRLVPGGAAQREDLKPGITELPLGRGEHLLVPVSEEAEQRLERFRGLLREMSPDVEALLLDTLRNPSLEVRLSRVEEQLGVDGAGKRQRRQLRWPRMGRGAEARGTIAARRRLGTKRKLLIVFAALAVLALAVAGWWRWVGGFSEASEEQDVERVTDPGTGRDLPSGIAPGRTDARREATGSRGEPSETAPDRTLRAEGKPGPEEGAPEPESGSEPSANPVSPPEGP